MLQKFLDEAAARLSDVRTTHRFDLHTYALITERNGKYEWEVEGEEARERQREKEKAEREREGKVENELR